MVKSFVFGKFLPFHKGHEAMIRFALTQSDVVTVLVCVSDLETIPAATRMQWLQDTFAAESRVEVRLFEYCEAELANTSVSSRNVSKVWAEVFTTLLPEHTILVTSEPYGDFVAEYMGIRHILFDRDRNAMPVSASLIRKAPFTYWEFIPEAVRPFYVKKIVLLGTESTGKTKLTQQLAAHFGGACVLEAGRDLIPDSNEFTVDDLYLVAAEHARRIEQAVAKGPKLVFVDTDIHITQSYACRFFGKELDVAAAIYDANKADLYLYLNADAPFVQDGTRLDEAERNALDHSHRATLKWHNILYYEISGNWEKRFAIAVKLVDGLIAGY
ncbi:AAA family ATPase [Chitinophagaceae bacterium MMS25-I14]